jgi:CRP-like cAMP-binding protein
MRRTATIRCSTPCILYSLSKQNLDEVLEHHPQMAHAIRKIAEERLEIMKTTQSSAPPKTDGDIRDSLDEIIEDDDQSESDSP